MVILGVRSLEAGTLTLARRVGGRTEVLEACLLGQHVEALLLVVLPTSRGQGKGDGEQERGNGREMHLDSDRC